jgi:hypothetical protein
VWVLISIATVAVWSFFFAKSRRLARALDRGEAAVLKPLAMTYLLLAIAFGVSRAWVPAAASATALFLTSAIGTSLHRGKTFRELARGTLINMEVGPGAKLSHDEAFVLARATMSASAVAGLFLLVVLLHSHVRWYIAFPAAAASAYLLMIIWAFVAAYRRKREEA